MGRIALSLQDLVERQQKEIADLKTEKAGIQKMLDIQMRVRKQHEAKIEKQTKMLEHNMKLMENQDLINSDLLGLLAKRRSVTVRFFNFLIGEKNDNN